MSFWVKKNDTIEMQGQMQFGEENKNQQLL